MNSASDQTSSSFINSEVMFSDHKSVYKKGLQNRRMKLVSKHQFIQAFLEEGEQVLLVTTGCSPITAIEQLIMGWVVFVVKRALFVFTSNRILIVPVGSSGKYRNSLSYIRYGDCKDIRIKMGSLNIEYSNGKKERFYYIQGNDRKKIRSILSTLTFSDYQTGQKTRISVCPKCKSDLEKGKYTCPSCGLEFKSKESARKISIIFPGGGYFYTRHSLLGIGDAITETILTLSLIFVLLGVDDASGAYVAVFLAGVLLIEKLVTIYDSNKFIDEFITKDASVIF
jgi:hypothetical protein